MKVGGVKEIEPQYSRIYNNRDPFNPPSLIPLFEPPNKIAHRQGRSVQPRLAEHGRVEAEPEGPKARRSEVEVILKKYTPPN